MWQPGFSLCSARLQAGITDSSTCSPEFERYRVCLQGHASANAHRLICCSSSLRLRLGRGERLQRLAKQVRQPGVSFQVRIAFAAVVLNFITASDACVVGGNLDWLRIFLRGPDGVAERTYCE